MFKSDGHLLIGVPGRKGCSAPDHEIYYSREDLVRLLGDYQFRLLSFSYIPFKLIFRTRSGSTAITHCLRTIVASNQ